ncbi:ribosomal protein S18-alanine N-acetyltransferase [Clostridiisalibacter paucivorans]|uniref:ribosomal protein S18-alanine N-acetyltransferase n=1 Tax=Clostridiisalibacter paucivorans TaxID=408753 RepID=UPI00047941A8|nr:ribosomal protein S18-alanine N-acetyltransferase [Clostridiisalibacter paucivorans]
MDNVVVRNMTLADIDQVLEIEKECFSIPWSKESFITEVEKNILAEYIVVEIANKVVGYGGIWLIMDEGHITNIGVSKSHRGYRVGSIILEKIIDICKEKGIPRITLEVREHNYVAQGLYEKYDFKVFGIRPNYYSDNNENALIMWKNIEK